jgi:hypothetical protein
MTKPITLEVSEDAVRLFGGDEARFARELVEAAVVKWYDEGRVSSGKGADFLDLLFRHKVSPFQYSPEELAAEVNRG